MEIEPYIETAAELSVDPKQGDDACPTPAPDATVETEIFTAPAVAAPLYQEPVPEAEGRALIPAPHVAAVRDPIGTGQQFGHASGQDHGVG